MRVLGAVSLCAMLGACAFSPQVERFGVEYNSALAGMNNEQTLLNILRARDGMPTHFTSVSQFRGNINLTATASVNGQLRGEGLTQAIASGLSNTTATTASTTTNVSATPSTTTVASTVTTPVMNSSTTSTIAEGVDLYTPQLSGQIVSGSAFDVAVFDSQKFFQGITNSIPFSTIDTLLNRGMDNRVLAALAIARVDFRIDVAGYGHARGDTIATVINDASDAQSAEFARFLNCYELASAPAEPANLVAISRLTRGADGNPAPIALDKVTVIDGERFGLSSSAGIGSDPADDAHIFLTRLTGPRRIPRLSPRSLELCTSPGDRIANVPLAGGGQMTVAVPANPSADAIYLGNGRAALYSNADRALHDVPVVMEITFRSPEGLFNYLGAYLRQDPRTRINIDGQPLFSIADGRNRDALAQANYRGRYYSLVNDYATGTRNAQIFTLLQQLINLHKDGADRPTAIPVRAIP